MKPKYEISQQAKLWTEDNIVGNKHIQDCVIMARYKDSNGYFYRVNYNIVFRGGYGKPILGQYPSTCVLREEELFLEC